MKRIACLLLLLCCAGAQATTLQSLIAEDKLRLRSWLEPAGKVAVGQEVQLVVEIATPRWFAGGTQIQPPEVANLVILRRNEFAINSSRREQGATWVVQQWHLELYPQQAGEFLVPPIDLELAVNDADAGIVRGSLQTEQLQFLAVVPPLLEGSEDWIATPSLEVEQRFDRKLEGLVAGDAFQRRITLRATRVAAMMLPEAQFGAAEGLAAYADNPELENRSNRGEATALRRETITYVVEQEGQYLLPEQVFQWWDTDSQSVQTAILPAVEVDAGVASEPVLDSRILKQINIDWRWVAAGLLALITAMSLNRWRQRRRHGDRQLLALASKALRKGDRALAVQHLYSWLNRQGAHSSCLSLRNAAAASSDSQLLEDIELLLQEVYSGASVPQSPVQRLPRSLLKRRGGRFWNALRPAAVELKLNPSDQPRK